MSNLVSLTKYKNKKEKEKQKEVISNLYAPYDYLLDYCEEYFPEGALVIALEDGDISIASNEEDKDRMLEMLVVAIQLIQKEKENDV